MLRPLLKVICYTQASSSISIYAFKSDHTNFHQPSLRIVKLHSSLVYQMSFCKAICLQLAMQSTLCECEQPTVYSSIKGTFIYSLNARKVMQVSMTNTFWLNTMAFHLLHHSCHFITQPVVPLPVRHKLRTPLFRSIIIKHSISGTTIWFVFDL